MVSMTLDRRIRSLNRSWMIDDHGTRVMIFFYAFSGRLFLSKGICIYKKYGMIIQQLSGLLTIREWVR